MYRRGWQTPPLSDFKTHHWGGQVDFGLDCSAEINGGALCPSGAHVTSYKS